MTQTNTDIPIELRLSGHRFWYINDRFVPVIRGGDGDDDDGDDDGDGDGDGDGGDRTFTQDDLDRIGTRERRSGRRAALREIMEKLGFDKIEDAEAFVAAARKVEDQVDGDAEQAQQRAAAREAALDDREATLTRRERDIDLRTALLDAGAPNDPSKLRDMVGMLTSSSELGDDPDEDEIGDAVDDLKSRWPAMFESDEDENENDSDEDPGPDTVGRHEGGRRKRPRTDNGMEKGASRFAARHPRPASTTTT